MPPEKPAKLVEALKGARMFRMRSRSRYAVLAAVSISALAPSAPALAQDQRRTEYRIEARDLGEALKAVSRQSGKEIIFTSAAVLGHTAPALRGTYTADEAVQALLKGSGLVAQYRKDVVIIRGRSEPSGEIADRSAEKSDIVVTGSRIQGTRSASNTIVIEQAEMVRAGQRNLSDVVQSIPQNFGGGQNPGVALNVPSSSGENVGGGTSINLRGLGQDATLTLLNGQRLVYGGYRQSVDVGSIPFVAVDRIEIVPDGASAIYGSDAVAGVANIILKPDYDGLLTSAQIGAATAGGNRQQQYDVIGGKTWAGGGFLAAYEFGRSTAVDASQRSYAAVPNKGLTLYPFLKHHGAVVSGHQEITGSLSAKIDAIYNWRADRRGYAISAAANASSYSITSGSWMLAVTPSLQWNVGPEWTLNVAGSYGIDHTRYGNDLTIGGATTPSLRACYCNRSWSAEVNAQGTVFMLPSGPVKMAVGGGGRKNSFHAYRTVGQAQDIDVSQSSHFGYGELNVPLVSPDQANPLAHHASFTGAVRYESYPGVDSLATPKFGLIYAPIRDVELKATWGKSFKAPTLYQRYNDQGVLVYTAASRGGSGYPATATALFVYGGQPDLEAERATTWSAGISFDPIGISGLHIEASYFHVTFDDRVVAPINSPQRSLSNPVYTDLVTLAPTSAQVADAMAGRLLYNYADGAFNPANVVAIIDNRNRNVAAQNVQGVDVTLRYKFAIGATSHLMVNANGSYLESSQQILPGSASTQLAGTYFNPPHFRGRGGMIWVRSSFSLAGFINYVGGSEDNRYPPAVQVGGMTTADLAANYALNDNDGILSGLEFSVVVNNLLDQRPPQSRSAFIYEPTYDSTNYSPIGRLVSFGITKRW